MKNKFYLLLSSILIGCASQPAMDAAHTPQRDPASSGITGSLGRGLGLLKPYQGPIEIHLKEYQRQPALTYLPLQYDREKTWPLVVLLHGFTGTAEAEDIYLGLRFRASRSGFILMTPQGTRMPAGTQSSDGRDLSGVPFWNATDKCCDFAQTGVDDSGYLLSLVDHVKKTYKVDPTRVYLIGHSNGGFMANRLACEAGENFAGIANLAGGSYKDPKKCQKPTAIPYLQIHAVDDKTILYGEDPDYAGGQETVAQWQSRNGCGKETRKGKSRDFVYLIPGNDTEIVSWENCRSGRELSFWTIRNHRHQWHNAHIPLFKPGFMDAVLDFLMKQKSE